MKTLENDFILKFTDKNIYKEKNSRYLGYGSFTAVFSVNLLKQPTYSKIPSEKLILRVFTQNTNKITDLIPLIDKYENEKKYLINSD